MKLRRLLLLGVVAAAVLLLAGCGCKHENAAKEGVVAATCTEDGFTGDLVCPDCKKTIEKGEVVPAAGHTPKEYRVSVQEANCRYEGYTGDVYCLNCDELLEKGEVIPVADHTPGERKYMRDPECIDTGYTGDIYCEVCGTVLESGESIPPLGHDVQVLEGVKEPTCTEKGYTGDGNCERCGYLVRGEEIDRIPHDNDENGVCKVCGWKPAGLYVDGKMELTWDDILASSYIEMSGENSIKSANTALIGELVIDESITDIYSGAFRGSQLTSVVLPCGITYIADNAFSECPNLESVVPFGKITRVMRSAFYNSVNFKDFPFEEGLEYLGDLAFGATAITEVVLPSTLTELDGRVFMDCTQLSKVVLNEGLESVEDNAFRDCIKLTEIEVPDTVTHFMCSALYGTSIKKLVLPESVIKIQDYSEQEEIVVLDFSKTSVSGKGTYRFSYNPKLEELYYPAGMPAISASNISGNPSLKILVLPSALTEIDTFYAHDVAETSKKLSVIVWPASLTDASVLGQLTGVKVIYFTGSEFQWSLVNGKENLENVRVVFNSPYVAADELKEMIYQDAAALKEAGDIHAAFELYNVITGYADVDDILNNDPEIRAEALTYKYSVGNEITFGVYEQNNLADDGKEAIEWIILDADGDSRLLLSKKVLDCMQYNKTEKDTTWASSDIRKWVNSTFYDEAFSDEEKAIIKQTKVVPDKTEGYDDTDAGKSTEDNVFFLTYKLVDKYFEDVDDATAKATKTAEANGCYTYDGNAGWWMSATGHENYYAAVVSPYGYYNTYNVTETELGIRPVIWIDATELLK